MRSWREGGKGYRIRNALFVKTESFARPPELSPHPGHGRHWFGNAEGCFLIGDAPGEGMKKLLSGAAR